MKIAKPTEADVLRFRDVFDDREGVLVKPMFGNLAAFVETNQQMCAGLFGSALGLRLDPERLPVLLAEEGSGPFGPEGRPMKAYAVLPSAWTSDQSEPWIAEAIAHTSSLPLKKKKAKKKKA